MFTSLIPLSTIIIVEVLVFVVVGVILVYEPNRNVNIALINYIFKKKK